ncbi:MAG: LysM peptidoglycan-binding domain-containing protein [Syntrophaceae bacterium]
MTQIQKVSLFLILFMVILSPFHVFAQNKILNIRHWAAPDHTRVVFDADNVIPYTIDKADRKLSIVFQNTDMPENFPAEIILKKRGIEKIILSILPEKNLRVELSIDANVETKVFTIKKIQDKPDRVVIDILFPDVVKQETKEREEIKVLQKNKIIVIDPGHGGEAPGAVGRKGTLEKKVVLEISRKLREVLNTKDGYRAYLTRDGDYYVPFKKRMKIAREYGADLFISIHADASKRRIARGSSVYCLSVRGASNEAAKLLARNENLADIIGGSSNGENSDESDPIILNMFQTNTINSSKIFGSRVLRNLRRVNYVKYGRVQEAPFIVLKLPEIPSLLVETAFISNPQEEKLLKSSRYQADIAKSIAAAITDFLTVEPLKQQTTPKIILTKEIKPKSPDTSDKSATSKVRSTVYKVEKGDTLEKIAIKFNTRISTLLKLNNMDIDDPLYFGRSIKVPAQEKNIAEKKNVEEVKTSTVPSETPPVAPAPPIIVHKGEDDKNVESSTDDTKSPPSKPAPTVRVYKVKKGDSLDKIARRHNTTVSDLLKLNKMKFKESLYVGKNIKVPTQVKEIAEKKKDEAVKTSSAVTVSSAQKPEPVVSVYKVKKGDTVEKIAKKHNTTISVLLKLNNMKLKEPLYFGRKLKVPSTEKKKVEVKKTVVVKHKVHTYRVKKGDTLDKIAQKYKTSISELRALNKMKRTDVLYVDQKLKLPSNSTL